MKEDDPVSPAAPGGFGMADAQDPLAAFPTEDEVAAAQAAEAQAAVRKAQTATSQAQPVPPAQGDRARRVAVRVPRIRRQGRRWLGALAFGALVMAAAVMAFLAFPDVASLIRGRLASRVADSPATLVVETTPPGWEVTEGARRLGTTPVTVSLPPGSHSLVLRSGSSARPLEVRLPRGAQVVHHLDMAPTAPSPATGALQVTTVPPGATVSVDGAIQGRAPVGVSNLAPGDHTVTVAVGYRVVNQRVTVKPGETAALLVPLAQAAPPQPPAAPAAAAAPVGWVRVAAGIELQVYEGDSLIGSSRNQRIMLMPGPHTLRLVNTAVGFETTSTVTVAAGALGTIAIQVPNGSLSVNAVPWAEVVLDGAVIGETPIANYPVALGSHELVLRNPRYAEQRRTVVVSLASPAHVGVDLRQ